MGYNLCNSETKIRLNIKHIDIILEFATFYGWNAQSDSTSIYSALCEGIEDAKTGKRDNELIEHLSPIICGMHKKLVRRVIKLVGTFIEFHRSERYIIE